MANNSLMIVDLIHAIYLLRLPHYIVKENLYQKTSKSDWSV